MSARPPRPPRRGAPLAAQVQLTPHAVARFRRRATELAGDDPEARLAVLIGREGVVPRRPPRWFHGEAPHGGYLISLAGDRYVLPVSPVPVVDAIPAKPWIAVTFISRELCDEDLHELSGDRLAALTLITERVARKWVECTGRAEGAYGASPAADAQPADARTRLRLALATVPRGGALLSWVPADVAGRDELRVDLGDGFLVLVRRTRGEGHPARFRTAGWSAHR